MSRCAPRLMLEQITRAELALESPDQSVFDSLQEVGHGEAAVLVVDPGLALEFSGKEGAAHFTDVKAPELSSYSFPIFFTDSLCHARYIGYIS